MKLIEHFVGGKIIPGSSDKKGKVFNPATGEQEKQVRLASSSDLDQAVEIAKKAFETWSLKPSLQRARIMFKFKELIEKNSDELTQLIVSEHGKVYEDAKGSLTRGLEVVEFACGIPHLLKGEFSENVGTDVDSWSMRQPLGVVAGITPFNFPAMVPMWMFPIAIACGNTFILKPSEKDPSCAIRLAELLKEAGLPDGVFNVVNGDKEAVDAILNNKDIKAVSFVGSTPIAKYIYENSAKNEKRVQALGGAKNHLVVMPDCDLDGAVYAFNYLWAPLIDRIQIPYLTKKIGHRRGWIVLMQIIILLSLALWSLLNPSENLALVVSVGLIIAIASSTQDITVDALRIEQIGENEGKSMAAGAAMAVVGWWTGYKLGGVLSLFAADILQNIGFENYWQLTFLILGILVILMNIGLMFIDESGNLERQNQQKENDKLISSQFKKENIFTKLITWVAGTISGPIISFFKKNSFSIALGILGFVFLFKVGEAFLGRMSIIFYKEIGFSKSDIAIYSKTLGWITTVTFTLLGGLFVIRSGVLKAMFFAGVMMASTNLLFSVLAWSDKSEFLFAIAVIFDDIAAAFATVAFVAFISMLVDRAYTATQYALLASIGTAGRTTLASSSGALVDWLNGDWGIFFILTALMVIPSLIILWIMKNKLQLSEK